VRGFSQDAVTFMHSYSWPGNVRELMNYVRRAMVMGEGRLIKLKDLGLERRENDRNLATLDEVRTEAVKRAIQCALDEAHNQISLAADTLGISRITLYRLPDKSGIQRRPAESHSLQQHCPRNWGRRCKHRALFFSLRLTNTQVITMLS